MKSQCPDRDGEGQRPPRAIELCFQFRYREWALIFGPTVMGAIRPLNSGWINVGYGSRAAEWAASMRPRSPHI